MENTRVQDKFIAKAIESEAHCKVFLGNGVKLVGRITESDDVTITIDRDGVEQLAYKHAISTILPSENYHGFAD